MIVLACGSAVFILVALALVRAAAPKKEIEYLDNDYFHRKGWF